MTHHEQGADERPDPEFRPTEPAASADPTASEFEGSGDAPPRSLNASTPASAGKRKVILGLFIVLMLAMGGIGVWYGGQKLTEFKDHFKDMAHHGQHGQQNAADAKNPLAPEATRTLYESKRPLGAAGALPASEAASGAGDSGETVRPVRGADGKVMLDANGNALGVDRDGHIVQVPPITAMAGEGGRRPLPGPATTTPGTPGAAQQRKPPSRYGGALFADGSGHISQEGGEDGGAASAPGKNSSAAAEVLKALLSSPNSAQARAQAQSLVPATADQPTGKNSGPVASQMTSSVMPVARASRMQDQSLLLPRNRQVDCILTTRIVNELPGFTSCVMAGDLYSADGTVKLLENGSEVSGEYGVSNQQGTRRLFIVWTRVRTPLGVQIDLQSPGTDPLGTSGVPGYLEERWGERIGAALLLSTMKDVIQYEISKQQAQSSSSTAPIVVTPGQSTIQTGQDLVDEVLKQTINIRPTLNINEGTRVAIYVARDLDFSPVYKLTRLEGSAMAEAR